MGNKIVTIITSFVMLMAFILMVAFISTDTQTDKSKQLVREFTETVRYKGYITLDQYEQLVNSIPYKNIKVQLTHTRNDSFGDFSPGTLDMRFTTQIMSAKKGYKIETQNGGYMYSGSLLNSESSDKVDKHMYKMQVGEQIQVDLFVMDGTFFDTIVSMFTGKSAPSIKILTSASGVILNEKYDHLEGYVTVE